MGTPKLLPRLLPLGCLVVVSLFCLIDNSEGASSQFGGKETSHTSPVVNSTNLSSRESEAGTRLFSRPIFRKRRRSTTNPVKASTVPSNIILSDRIDDTELSYENETLFETRNKTVSLYDKVDPAIQEEDNFCPDFSSKRSVLQSILPAFEIILFAVVNVVVFVVFLYGWKNIYYEQEDPYATISPYGFGPGPTTPAPSARSLERLDKIISTVQKSIHR